MESLEACVHSFKWLGHVNREGFFYTPKARDFYGSLVGPAPEMAEASRALMLDGVAPSGRLTAYTFKSDDRVNLFNALGEVQCSNPVLYRCSLACGAEYLGNCNSRDVDTCEPCEKRYRTRVRGIARIPMMVAKKGSVLLMTLTAPGVKRHCLTHTYKDKKGKVQPSTRCDWDAYDLNMIPADGRSCVECLCSEHRFSSVDDLRDFNSTIGRKFNDFVTDIRRTFPEFEKVQYFRANEPQARGALHIHVLFIMKRVAKIDSALSDALTNVAMRLGFGHQLDIRRVADGELDQVTAARYVAKYVSKTDGFKRLPFNQDEEFKDLDYDTMRMKKVLKFRRPRTWSCSRGWGLSMSSIVFHQSLYSSGAKDSAEEYLQGRLDVLRTFQHDPLDVLANC